MIEAGLRVVLSCSEEVPIPDGGGGARGAIRGGELRLAVHFIAVALSEAPARVGERDDRAEAIRLVVARDPASAHPQRLIQAGPVDIGGSGCPRAIGFGQDLISIVEETSRVPIHGLREAPAKRVIRRGRGACWGVRPDQPVFTVINVLLFSEPSSYSLCCKC